MRAFLPELPSVLLFNFGFSSFKCFYDYAMTELGNLYANRTLIVSCTRDNTLI